MLSKETKKKIDDARDILVGQLPLPSDQVELITIALIYKFMDDQDEDLRQLGFEEAFFSGDLKEYSWQRLMSNEIDADERVNKFIKGIEEIQKAEHIPLLFREIFKNTFLKFRDGRTLYLFLGGINGFSYDHSEELGNAFEYLLMSMGAQGENGQFRTPRNIIDFIVEVVDPDKEHTILDPACGTGGFLLSAYKHILRKSTTGKEHYRITLSNEEIEGIPVNWGDKLTTQDQQKLGVSIEGYDITPQMVRLARVNLFLHQFKSPRIHEYDTLTSTGRWQDKYDCILANPPFMTPKGGISTHSKFRIRATKAEVLFSDYILEHLTPDGMAGFIVPEGIIFQNSGDYVSLRKWMVEATGLWAVVSLPAQIFQPYSGVKTSILFIDRQVARTRDEIILVKVEHDGYSLNTNRAPISKNDLPEALNLLTIGKQSLDELRNYLELSSDKPNMPQVLIKSRKEFARLDAYKAQTSAFSLIRKQHEKCVALEEEIKNLPIPDEKNRAEVEKKRVRLQTAYTKQKDEFFKVAGITYDRLTTSLQDYFDTNLKEAVIAYGADRAETGNLSSKLREHLEEEREYSLSFERYRDEAEISQKCAWGMVPLSEICTFMTGGTPTSTILEYYKNGTIPWLVSGDIHKKLIFDCEKRITELGANNSNARMLPLDSVLIALNGQGKTRGTVALLKMQGATCNQSLVAISSIDREKLIPEYLFSVLDSMYKEIRELTGDNQRSGLNIPILKTIKIPFPPLEIQKQIVAEIEAYQKVIDGCNLIIENYKPEFVVDENWKRVKLGDVFKLSSGKFLPKKDMQPGSYDVYGGNGVSGKHSEYFLEEPTLVIGRVGEYCGAVHISTPKAWVTDNGLYVTDYLINVDTTFLKFIIDTINLNQHAKTGGQPSISQSTIYSLTIPLPPLETQQKIVAELEQDLAAVAGAKRLKAKMAANIRAVIGRVWGKEA